MRITYRKHNVKNYWNTRWDDIPADQPMKNNAAYPLKYAEQIVTDYRGRVLEAGCGAGRILRYYHNKNIDIIGIDYIKVAIDKLKVADSTLKVEVGDITDLHFKNESFKYVLAFGLYHNLEYGLEKAIKETYRILEFGGAVCASFRADNIQTRLVDWLTEYKSKQILKKMGGGTALEFHKMNLTRSEFKMEFEKVGFIVDSIVPVENMPILYKFQFFRASSHKKFNENIARKEGYRLSWIGQKFQNLLMRFFPNQFCNIYVMIARKK